MTAFLDKWKKHFTVAALFSCLVNILQLTFPFYMFTIYRNVVISYSVSSLINITFAAVCAIAALGLFSYLRSRLLAAAGADLSLMLRREVFATMVRGSVIDPRRAYQGGLNDLDTLRNFFSSPAIYALFDAPWAPFYLALIFLIHPVLGLIAGSGAVVMIGLNGLQELLIRRSMREANERFAHNQRFVDSFLRNTEVINGMGMIGAVSDRFIRGNTEVLLNQTRSSNYAAAIQAMLKPLQNLVQVLIYCSGAYYAIMAGFNVGLMVAASIMMGRSLGPLMQFMSSWQTTSRARDAYRRLAGLTEFSARRPQTLPLPLPQGRIEVSGVSFRINERLLLANVSFALAPGEFMGIIGPSGAGKTTLCRLLLGIWPPLGGRVALDGQDIFAWDKEEVGAAIGYLPQEIELFPGTVAENIARLGQPEERAIAEAIELSGLGSLIEELPEGLATQLEGEQGIKLSGGQKQKIGLARAVYNRPALLVLDEPTSNLDEQGEQQLLRVLATLHQSSKCTCVMVTHKPSLLQSMDKVLVLREGRVALFGPRDAVFAALAGKTAEPPEANA